MPRRNTATARSSGQADWLRDINREIASRRPPTEYTRYIGRAVRHGAFVRFTRALAQFPAIDVIDITSHPGVSYATKDYLNASEDGDSLQAILDNPAIDYPVAKRPLTRVQTLDRVVVQRYKTQSPNARGYDVNARIMDTGSDFYPGGFTMEGEGLVIADMFGVPGVQPPSGYAGRNPHKSIHLAKIHANSLHMADRAVQQAMQFLPEEISLAAVDLV